MYRKLQKLKFFAGLHSMHVGPSDIERRTLTSAMSYDNVLKMLPKSEQDDHHHLNHGSPTSAPEGPVRFSIDG